MTRGKIWTIWLKIMFCLMSTYLKILVHDCICLLVTTSSAKGKNLLNWSPWFPLQTTASNNMCFLVSQKLRMEEFAGRNLFGVKNISTPQFLISFFGSIYWRDMYWRPNLFGTKNTWFILVFLFPSMNCCFKLPGSVFRRSLDSVPRSDPCIQWNSAAAETNCSPKAWDNLFIWNSTKHLFQGPS